MAGAAEHAPFSDPGQALSYKLGELTIRRLRGEAEAALGPKFDLRRFHDAILALGSGPLPVLEDLIAAFISREESASLGQTSSETTPGI